MQVHPGACLGLGRLASKIEICMWQGIVRQVAGLTVLIPANDLRSKACTHL